MTAALFLPEKKAELTRSATCPRGKPAREAVPHLPGAVLNEVTECGWHQDPLPVRKEMTQRQKAARATNSLIRMRSNGAPHPYFAKCVCAWCAIRRPARNP